MTTRQTNPGDCKETKTPEQAAAEALLKQRAQLLRIMTSGVEEIQQPVLGTTRYRSFADLQRSLGMLNAMSGTGGATITVVESTRTSSSCGSSSCGCAVSWNRWGDCF